MRLLAKRKYLRLIDRMIRVHQDITKMIDNNKYEAIYEELIKLQKTAIELGEDIELNERTSIGIVPYLEKYCEDVYQFSLKVKNADVGKIDDEMEKLLKHICRMVVNTDTEVKIAFFPYKYSMWDSLKDVWKMAKEDSRCNCQVVPIAYYNRDSQGQLLDRHYEGQAFIDNGVNIIDCDEYDLEKERPDIVYIHNPYDDANFVTCIDERFYARRIKACGCVLVYVPYYVEINGNNYEELDAIAKTWGMQTCDLAIVQNEATKQGYICRGLAERKLLVMGSPKIDTVYRLKESPVDVRDEWKKKTKGKKTIILGTTLQGFLNDASWLDKMNEIVSQLIDKEDVALIWRPHPLTEATMVAMRQEYTERYQELLERVNKAENGIVDFSDYYAEAFSLADAMIGEDGSMPVLFMYTGKPVLMLQGTRENDNKIKYIDYQGCYFLQDGISIEHYIEMVRDGSDEKKDERMYRAEKSVAYLGESGKMIHETIMKMLCYWEQF